MDKDKFIGWLTALVVLGYISTAGFAFIRNGLAWQDFSATVGPISGLLLGYWVRGEK